MKKKMIGSGRWKALTFIFAFGLSLALVAAGPAHAVGISGTIAFSDGMTVAQGGTSIVSGYSNGSAVNLDNVVDIFTSANGDFSGVTGALANDFTIGTNSTLFITSGGTVFSFFVSSYGALTPSPVPPGLSCDANNNCSDSILITISGAVTGAGFDSTAFSGNITLNGACLGDGAVIQSCTGNTALGSWSSTLVANAQPLEIPEPASLLLFGFGLAGLGFWSRKRQD